MGKRGEDGIFWDRVTEPTNGKFLQGLDVACEWGISKEMWDEYKKNLKFKVGTNAELTNWHKVA